MGSKIVAACSIEQILKLSHPDRGLSIQDTDITFVFLVAKIEKWLPNEEGLFNASISDFSNQVIELLYDKSESPPDALLHLPRTPESSFRENLRHRTMDNDSAPLTSPVVIQISSSSSSSNSSITPAHQPSPASSTINPGCIQQYEGRGTGIGDYETMVDWSSSDEEGCESAAAASAALNQKGIQATHILDSSSASSMRLKPGTCYVGNENVVELLIKEIESQEAPSIRTTLGESLLDMRIGEYISILGKVVYRNSQSMYVHGMRVSPVVEAAEIKMHRLENIRDTMYYEMKRLNQHMPPPVIECTHLYYDQTSGCFEEIYYCEGSKNYEDCWNKIPGLCSSCRDGKKITRNIAKKSYMRFLEIEKDLNEVDKRVFAFIRDTRRKSCEKKDFSLKKIAHNLSEYKLGEIISSLERLESLDLCVRSNEYRWSALIHEWI